MKPTIKDSMREILFKFLMDFPVRARKGCQHHAALC